MFGESDSESPRVGSPWDSFISAAAELEVKPRMTEGVPKLVPEVEYGNVEYKLKLLNPSPERFTRLVTQMKWRLLEGGGQAYYELGVADSGQLVGLPRCDLEQSLETLEMMAGDIGASVVVVKEIEIPAALVGCGMSSARALGIPQRTPGPREEPETSAGTGTGTSTTTETETEEDDGLETDTPPDGAHPLAYRQNHFTSSSPAVLLPADADAALFHPDFEIEIASVYKPRPHRVCPAGAVAQSRYTKRGAVKKPAPAPVRDAAVDPAAKAVERRLKRDARRDRRRRALVAPEPRGEEPVAAAAAAAAVALRELHVGLAEAAVQPPLAIRDEGEGAVVPEPRLIVEALVVRKLALEEAFLDFGGFALEI